MSSTPQPFGIAASPPAAAAAYGVLHFIAVGCGLALQIEPPSFAVFWPAAGTLLAALLLYPPRDWAWLIAAAVAAEIGANLLLAPQISLTAAATLSVVSGLEAFAGAYFVRRIVGERINFGRLGPLLCFGSVIAVTTGAGGLLAAMLLQGFGMGSGLIADLRAWWIGDLLGAATIAPLLLSFGYFGLRPHHDRDSRLDLHSATAAVLLVVLTLMIFLRRPDSGETLLESPSLLYPALIWLAMSSGPRRTALGVLFVIAVASIGTLVPAGPFSLAPSRVAATAQLQVFLAFVIVPTLILQAVMFERRRATRDAERSDERYRAFIANSSESIFRAELAQPMPIALPVDEQIEWLRKHMYVAECNPAFLAAQGSSGPDGAAVGTKPAAHLTWSGWYIERIREAIANGYQVKDIEVVIPGPYGLDRVMLISMFGIVETGLLRRIWGTGRDVTALRQAQASLAEHDAKLRQLATEITLAEERARRRLAADLHDGPAQNLIGITMELGALKRTLTNDIDAARMTEVERIAAETNQQIRTLMAELMPPGLYDAGIVAGLRWLTEHLSKQKRISITLEDDGAPKPLDEHSTVIVFQTVRELLQNVAKHARARQAIVRCALDGDRIVVDVIDPGIGFDASLLGNLPGRDGGFGLFSIRERLALLGGTLRVHSTVGQGTRVRVTAPLKLQGSLFDRALSA